MESFWGVVMDGVSGGEGREKIELEFLVDKTSFCRWSGHVLVLYLSEALPVDQGILRSGTCPWPSNMRYRRHQPCDQCC